MAKIEEIRKTLDEVKLLTLRDLKDDASNLDDVLKNYRLVAKLGKTLAKTDGQQLIEALTAQSGEYQFFRMCLSNLKGLSDCFEHLHRHERGKKYEQILGSKSKELNDRAINQVIDGNAYIFSIWLNYLKVKELQDRFYGLIDSYNQRGYAMNNITKAMELGVSTILL
jgi:hypothetical protein